MARSFRFLGKGREYHQELGFGLGIRWYAARAVAGLRVPSPERIEMKLRGLLYRISVRMKGSSDEFLFDEIFVRRGHSSNSTATTSRLRKKALEYLDWHLLTSASY
jgi:hypothetical protein